MELDIETNRKERKYSIREQLLRILWIFCALLFRLTPRISFGLRNSLLRLFGAKVGQHVHIYNTARIYMPWNLEIGDWSAIGEQAYIYNLEKVTIGSRVTISQRTHLCTGTHDYTDPALSLIMFPIEIGSQSWVAADAYIGPGVKIGEGAVVGARSVVTKDVDAWIVVAGNPARELKKKNSH